MIPNIICKIQASYDGGSSYSEIFSNVEGSTSIGDNWLTSGTTLTYDNSSQTGMGMTMHLKVNNQTPNTRVMVEVGESVKAVIETGATSSAFEISVPAGGKVALDFSQVFKVTTSLTNASITATSNVYEIGGTYYVKPNTSPTFTLASSEHYTNPPANVGVTGATQSYANGILSLSSITGDISITASATAMTYTITFNANGGTFTSGTTTTQSVVYNNTYSLPTAPTRSGYDFLGWATTSGASTASWTSGTKTCTGNTTWYAVWEWQGYIIYATINGENQKIGQYLENASEQTINISYPSTFTGIGGVLSPVAGVNELTSTQIKIAGNTTGDITVTPLGYTIGTYSAGSPSDSVTDVDASTTYSTGEVWSGYKYIQFNGADSYYNVDKATSYPMRWIIIGSGANDTSTYGTGGNINHDNLGSNQVLLLSEKTLFDRAYDTTGNSKDTL